MTRARNARGQFVKAGKPPVPVPVAMAAIDPAVGEIVGEPFLSALQASWARHGAETIETVRNDRPQDYLRLVASSLSKLTDETDDDPIATMSEEEIADELRRILGRLDPDGIATGARTGAAEEAQ